MPVKIVCAFKKALFKNRTTKHFKKSGNSVKLQICNYCWEFIFFSKSIIT